MIREHIKQGIRWFKRAIAEPREELNRWQRAARYAYDLGRFGTKQLKRDRAPQMAAALAFRTLFGMVPVFVVATILVRALIGIDEFLLLIDGLLTAAGLGEIHVVPPAEVAESMQVESVSLRVWIENLVGQAANVNVAAIGWVGMVLVIYAAIGLMVTIETSFSTVYSVSEGRSWSRRIPLYWFILTVSPLIIGLTSYLSSHLTGWVDLLGDSSGLLLTVQLAWNLLIGWLFLFTVYMFVPNANVAAQPAAIGAGVAVILVEIGKRTMGASLSKAFAISQLYGSLGLIPLFMFWVYLMWLVVLFGLELSATLQSLRRHRLDEIDRIKQTNGIVEPTAVLTMMELIAERFHRGQAITPHEISNDMGIPTGVVRRILAGLVDGGVIHQLDGDDRSVALAMPPDQINADRLLDVGFRLVDANDLARRSPMIDELRAAQSSLLKKVTLATLAAPGGKQAAP